MKTVVVIREVPDTEATITAAADGKTIDTSNIKFILNPYDEYAVEAGAQSVEQHGAECTLIALGGKDMTKTIRNAIAKGADKAGNIAFSKVIHLVVDGAIETYAAASKIAATVKDENADVVFIGKQYIDDDDYLMGSYLANMIDAQCVSVVTKIEQNGDTLTVTREIEGGSEVYDVSTPVVLTLQKGVNEPRYAGMKGIMKAKKVAIDTQDISLDDRRLEITSISQPPQKAAGRILNGDNPVAELVTALKDEAKVI